MNRAQPQNQSARVSSVGELPKALLDFISSECPSVSINGTSKSTLPPTLLAESLFKKLSTAEVTSRSVTEIAAITTEAAGALKTLLSEKSPSESIVFKKISLEDDPAECHRFILAQSDRPFIVTTLNDLLLEADIKDSLLLHPVLQVGDAYVSLAYIEFIHHDAAVVKKWAKELENALADLVLVTDDFQAMLGTVHQTKVGVEAAHTNGTTAHGDVAKDPRAQAPEVAAFLAWLADQNFVLLGSCNWEIKKSAKALEQFGVFRSESTLGTSLTQHCIDDFTALADANMILSVSRLPERSLVHRRNRVVHVAVRIPESADAFSFVGIFASKALVQESGTIPVIRKLLSNLAAAEQILPQSFDYRAIDNVINSLPKDETLSMGVDELQLLAREILGVRNQHDTRVTVRPDRRGRGVSVLIMVPRSGFNTITRDRIQAHLEDLFSVPKGASEYHLDLSDHSHARLYFLLPLASHLFPTLDLVQLEQDIAHLAQSWQDKLVQLLAEDDDRASGVIYGAAFPAAYQALYSPKVAFGDVNSIQVLDEDNPMSVSWHFDETDTTDCTLVLYSHGHDLALSESLPKLENAGLYVHQQQSSKIEPDDGKPPVFVHRFQVTLPEIISDEIKANLRENVALGLVEVFLKHSSDDVLNSLLVTAQLTPEQISLLRSYSALLGQISTYPRSTIQRCLARYPERAREIWSMFAHKLDPSSKASANERRSRYREEVTAFREQLREIESIVDDRILRSLTSLLTHTVRTNFFFSPNSIALKLRSTHIDIMPHPRPLYEVFVHSSRIQGTHLRSGKIARGGIRWSERPEDFRAEVLGLMKTQRVKNALIVPEGAKGGFVVRQLPQDATDKRAAVEAAYREYITALLSITDNRKGDEIVHPPQVVVLDGPDPYLVVAADKGTATFSDVANSIAVNDFDFWLGDAFASGGSVGYDHKKYGITARGAWECVDRHFRDIGLSPETTPVSVVGIGDMAGDVFGNGLIHSPHLKLLAAFNHMHIFVDPDPDPSLSFAERKRMFELPRSQWTDYDSNLISEGGGVFGRFDKEITLTPQIRAALSIGDEVAEVVNGEELIQCILKAKVDLLWNGGIGTYVKASSESNAEVKDGANDAVRIDATELRALVVGEGGNLGFTQEARIEFSEAGGRINTDAIDNSGGVDLSDHEVNLKILFADLIRQEKLTLPERNELLETIAADVVDDVLSHNRSHALTISIGESRSKKNIAYYRSLISDLHRRDIIDRHLEYLPDDDALQERMSKREGLTRPELAVCLAAVKMSLKRSLQESKLPSDPMLKEFLTSYFPPLVRERFKEAVLQHPLAQPIIITGLCNELLADTGITFVHRMCIKNSVTEEVVVKCALAALMILDFPSAMAQVKVLDTDEQKDAYIAIRRDLGGALRNATSWLIAHYGTSHTLAEMIASFKAPYQELNKQVDDVLVGESLDRWKDRSLELRSLGVDESHSERLALFPQIVSLLEMLWATKTGDKPVREVARVYSQVVRVLQLQGVLDLEKQIVPPTKWDNELLVSAYDEIRRSISRIALAALEDNVSKGKLLEGALTECTSYRQLHDTLLEIHKSHVSAAGISVIAKQLKGYTLATSE